MIVFRKNLTLIPELNSIPVAFDDMKPKEFVFKENFLKKFESLSLPIHCFSFDLTLPRYHRFFGKYDIFPQLKIQILSIMMIKSQSNLF